MDGPDVPHCHRGQVLGLAWAWRALPARIAGIAPWPIHVASVCLRRVPLASRGPPRAPPSWPEEPRAPSSLSTKQPRARSRAKRRVTDHRPIFVQHEGLRLVSVCSCHYYFTHYEPLGPPPRTASSFLIWLRLPFLCILAPEPSAVSQPSGCCSHQMWRCNQ